LNIWKMNVQSESEKAMKKITELLKNGNIGLTPGVVSGNEHENILYVSACDKISAVCADYTDTLSFIWGEGEIICRREFKNISDKTLELKELTLDIEGITFGENPRDDYFYHNENPRVYEAMTFPVDFDRNTVGEDNSDFDICATRRWADPDIIGGRIGSSPYMSFPAILLSNYNTKNGVIHGTLSQQVFYHSYNVLHVDGKIKLEVFSSFRNTDCLEIQPGVSVVDEWYLGVTDEADDIEKMFRPYIRVLRQRLPRTGENPNRTSLVWGSWNDGIFKDVNEQLIINEAKFIKDNFPTVKWIQLDDGYTNISSSSDVNTNDGISMLYEGENGLCCEKFPNGLRYLSDKIREIGLRPALWIGLLCHNKTRIFKEHPEWFIDYSYRVRSMHPLDVSLPQVREYMEKAVDVMLRQYGFEGVKLDFWSYAFEDKHGLYRNKDKSGGQYRRWWLSTLRKALPKDGYLEIACDLAQGNPFLGEYVSNHRYGTDIGSGNWEHIKPNYLWGVANVANHMGDIIIPNSDSIGMFPGLNENEAMFCINYCLVTHSMVEIAGKLSEATDKKRLAVLKKAVCNPNNGQDVHFVNFNYRSNKYTVPEIMYFDTPHFSTQCDNSALPLRTVGIFNISDEERSYTFTYNDLKLSDGEYVLTDVWNGSQYELSTFGINLPPHSSRLFAVTQKNSVVLLDANIRINSAKTEQKSMILETDYAVKDARLYFNKPVSRILYNGKDVPFVRQAHEVVFDLEGKGTLTVEFSGVACGFSKKRVIDIMNENCSCAR